MPITDFFNYLKPIRLYVTLMISVFYAIGQIILSHFTHSLTLQFAAYHMICNIIALAGRLLTIKNSSVPLTRQIDRNILLEQEQKRQQQSVNNIQKNETDKKLPDEENHIIKFSKTIAVPEAYRHNHEQKLRNTFGWVRIDCLTISICFIFLASFSISHCIEIIKVFTHMEIKDAAHFPVLVFSYGVLGIILITLAYYLIGGYTIHQNCYKRNVNENGDVIINVPNNTTNLNSNNESPKLQSNYEISLTTSIRSSTSSSSNYDYMSERQGYKDVARDIISTIFVLICSSIIIICVYLEREDITKYIDPIISLISCILLLVMSYPFMRDSCLVLLQTIPGSIDIEKFKKSLLSKFNEIVSVHDLHIWSLTANKYVSTAHIIFKNPESYLKVIADVKKFFEDQGICIVTIQPEFEKQLPSNTSSTNNILNNQLTEECRVSCTSLECLEKKCCHLQNDLKEIMTVNNFKDSKPKQNNIICNNDNDLVNEAKKIYSIMNVNSLQDVRTENSNTLNLKNNYNNNKHKVENSDKQIIKKCLSDSHISSTSTINSTCANESSIHSRPDNCKEIVGSNTDKC